MTVQRVKLAEITRPILEKWQQTYSGLDVDVEITAPSESATANGQMNEDGFWETIAQLDWSKTGNDDAVIEPAIQYLVRQSERAILTFFDLLSEKLYLLDGRLYAQYSSDDAGGFSSDLFLYARCCAVANGRERFEAVLKNPATFPKDLFFEAILDIPERAWFRKTGKKLEHFPKYMYETGFNPNGWGADTITL